MKGAYMTLLILYLLITFSYSIEKQKSFDNLLDGIWSMKIPKIAVAGGEGEEILKALRIAKDKVMFDSIIVGNERVIRGLAAHYNIDLSDFEIYDEPNEDEVAKVAVRLIRENRADIYMKGTTNMEDYVKAYLDKEYGLNDEENVLSVVSVVEVKHINHMIFLTDGGVNILPNLKEKVEILTNAVELCKSLGIENPRVAPIAAVEVVNPKMIETIEAKELTDMNERGEIKDCIVDGPLSFDLAIDPNAAKLKGTLNRKIPGNADILLFPDMTSANLGYKLFTHLLGAKVANVLTGTDIPCIFSSRSDSSETILNSVVVAIHYAEYMRKHSKHSKH